MKKYRTLEQQKEGIAVRTMPLIFEISSEKAFRNTRW